MSKATPEKCAKCSLFYNSNYFCAKLTPDELIDLNRESRTATLKRGESFTDEALKEWPIVAMSAGVLSMQHILEDGRKSIAALFMPGDVIDIRGTNKRNRGSLIALGKVELCRLSPRVFETLVQTNPEANRIIWDNLREQTFRAIDHSADLAKKQALEKLASFVFECSHRQPHTLGDKAIDIPIRRIDLGEYLGMQPETVSRCFKDLEERGIISLRSLHSVIIENVPALRRIANGDRSTSETTRQSDARLKILSFG